MFEKVLLAVDDTDRGADLVHAAMAITHPRRTEVRVAHIRRVQVGQGDRPGTKLAERATVGPLEDAARILRQSGYRATEVVRELAPGGVAEELLRLVDEFGPDLVVMGSRGSPTSRRF